MTSPTAMNRAAPRASNAAMTALATNASFESQNVSARNSATCFNSEVGTVAVSTIAIGRRVARQVGHHAPGGARDDGKRNDTASGGGPPTSNTAQAGAQTGTGTPRGTPGAFRAGG